MSDEEQVQEMFRRAVSQLGTVDILVNNAGLQRDVPGEPGTTSGCLWAASLSRMA